MRMSGGKPFAMDSARKKKKKNTQIKNKIFFIVESVLPARHFLSENRIVCSFCSRIEGSKKRKKKKKNNVVDFENPFAKNFLRIPCLVSSNFLIVN